MEDRLLALAYERYNRREYGLALALFRRAMRSGPPRPDLHCYAAHCLSSLGRFKPAVRLVSRLVRSAPAYLPGHLALADILRRRGGWTARARAAYRRVLELDPAHPRAALALKELAGEGSGGARGRAGERLRTSYREKGARAFSKGRWDRALGLLERAQGPRRGKAQAGLEFIALFRAHIESLRASGGWPRIEAALQRLWRLRREDVQGRPVVIEFIRRWITEQDSGGERRRLARICRWALRGRASAPEVLPEVGGALLQAAASARATDGISGGERLLNRFLSAGPCPAALRRMLLPPCLRWAAEYRAAGDLERARRLLGRLRRWAPRQEVRRLRLESAAVLHAQALESGRRGEWRAAARLWKRGAGLGAPVETLQEIESAFLKHVAALEDEGAMAKVERVTRSMARRCPESVAIALKWGSLLIKAGRSGQARVVLSRALARTAGPGRARRRLERFRIMVALSRYEEAFGEAEDILKTDRRLSTLSTLGCPWKGWADVPISPPALEFIRRRHLPALSSLIERGRHPAWARYCRGLLLGKIGAGRNDQADLELAARLPGFHPWMSFEMGLSRHYRGDFAGAIVLLRRALAAARAPHWIARAYLGEALVLSGRPADAFREFERAARAARPDQKGDALAWRGEMHLWLGQYRRALAVLDEAVAAGGTYAHTWRGAAKLGLGRAREALTDFDSGVKVQDDLEAWIWRGETRRLLGDYQGALRDLNRALRRTKDPWAYTNRALVRASLADTRGMRRDFSRIDPRLVVRFKAEAGLAGRETLTDRQMRRVLETGLQRHVGNRSQELDHRP